MRIFIYGSDGRLAVCRQLLLSAEERGEIPLGVRDVHLLPIPSYRFSLSDFSGDLNDRKSEVAREVAREGASVSSAQAVKGYDLIIGYGVDASFYEFEGVHVVDLEADESFLRRNARLTALGTIGVLLCEHTRALPELCVGVIGYGRIGRELVDILSFLECKIVVFSSNDSSREELLERGICTVSVSWKNDSAYNVKDYLHNVGFLQDVDVLLNTSPAKFADTFFDGYDGKIYDLASGEPIPQHVKYTRLASLPMRMYCESAGRAVYESIMRALYEIDREQI